MIVFFDVAYATSDSFCRTGTVDDACPGFVILLNRRFQ